MPCRAGAAATFCSAARIICTRNVLKFNYSILIRTYNCFLTKQPKIKQPQAKNSGTPHGRGLQKSHADDEAANHSHFVWTSKKAQNKLKIVMADHLMQFALWSSGLSLKPKFLFISNLDDKTNRWTQQNEKDCLFAYDNLNVESFKSDKKYQRIQIKSLILMIHFYILKGQF